MSNWPLRWQLALLTMCLVALVIVGAGAAASWHLYREGVADMDEDIQAVAGGLYSTIEVAGPGYDWTKRGALRDLLPRSHHLYLIEISSPDGQLLYRSRELVETPIPDPPGRASFGVIRLHNRLMRAGRFERNGFVIKIAMGMRSLRDAKTGLLRGYLIAGPIVLFIVAVGCSWIARRALSPVESIVASAERITAERLDRRLPVPKANDELRRLTDVLNLMIDRLEGSFRQATRFTADASHELKTPLTIIRGELESALRAGELTHAQEKLLVNLLEETGRLTRITEGLLLLSRADAGHLRIDPKRMDLVGLMVELLEDAEILAAPWGIAITHQMPARADVMGDAAYLRQLLLNLLDNAIKYNEHGGEVRLVLEQAGETWLIEVENTGPGIAEDKAQSIFDRFVRGDESRNRGRAGHGLGLSICREIARAHGGEIRLHQSRPGWTEFRVSLSARVPALPAPPAELAAR